MAHTVFISYAAEDKAVSYAVCEVLEESGVGCWIAPRDLQPGIQYPVQIVDAIAETRVMIVVLSSYSNTSPHVSRELERAVSQNIYVLPFRIEEVFPSKNLAYFINMAQWLDAFPRPSEEHYERIVETVEKLLAREDGRRVNEYEKGLRSIKDLQTTKQWVQCVAECCALFEKAMRKLLRNLLDWLEDTNVRSGIIKVQKKFGQGDRAFEIVELPQLVKLYGEAEIFSEIRKQLTSDIEKVKEIRWDQIVKWHSIAENRSGSTHLTEDDVGKMVNWVKILLYDCELAGKPHIVPVVPEEKRVLKKCSCCKQPLKKVWNYCPKCGVILNLTCEDCHRHLEPDWQICPYCSKKRVSLQRRGQKDDTRIKLDEYEILCRGAYFDGVVNIRERRELEKRRLELGLSREEAEKVEHQCAPVSVWEYTQLVQGVLVDGIISEDERTFLDKKCEQMNIDCWVTNQIEEVEIARRNGTLFSLGVKNRNNGHSQ